MAHILSIIGPWLQKPCKVMVVEPESLNGEHTDPSAMEFFPSRVRYSMTIRPLTSLLLISPTPPRSNCCS